MIYRNKTTYRFTAQIQALYFDDLAQDSNNSIANSLELTAVLH